MCSDCTSEKPGDLTDLPENPRKKYGHSPDTLDTVNAKVSVTSEEIV